jgi:hypothetical protein
MDLSTFNIINDTNFYTVWAKYTAQDVQADENLTEANIGQLKPVSIYENVHPEYFEYVSTVSNILGRENEEGYEIRLKKKVTGKVVIPDTFTYNNITKPVFIFSSRASESNSDNLLSDLSYVFLQRSRNNGTQTNISRILNYTFKNATNLKYFDFAEGLQEIRSAAF